MMNRIRAGRLPLRNRVDHVYPVEKRRLTDQVQPSLADRSIQNLFLAMAVNPKDRPAGASTLYRQLGEIHDTYSPG